MVFGQVRLAVFSGTVKIFFGQRFLSLTLPRKIGPYAYALILQTNCHSSDNIYWKEGT